MNFSFVVLTFHEDIQKLLSCLKTKYFGQVTIFIIEVVINVFNRQIMNHIKSVNYFGDSNANIPNYLRSALLLTV